MKLAYLATVMLLLISQVALAMAQSDDIEIYVIGFDIAKGSSEEASLKDFSSKMGGRYVNATTPEELTNVLISSYTGNLPPTTPSKSQIIFDNSNIAAVDNNPTCSPSFTITEPQRITYIETYHWNYGQGKMGGTISLEKDDGTTYGPWTVQTDPGMYGVPNAYWKCHPDIVIPAGTYTIIDSDPTTWSQNYESDGCGFSKVEGYSASLDEVSGSIVTESDSGVAEGDIGIVEPSWLSVTTISPSYSKDLVADFEALVNSQELPDHLLAEDAERAEGDFDVGLYFTVLDRLSMEQGQVLDYVYDYEEIGGSPILYAREAAATPYKNYSEYLAAEEAAEPAEREDYYLRHIETDGSPEGFFQLALLLIQGEQFYQFWHANYNDDRIVSSLDELTGWVGENESAVEGLLAQLAEVDLAPVISMSEDQVKVEVVVFTEWAAFSRGLSL